MIGVSMPDENRLHLCRIEAKRLESWQEIRLDLVRAQRIDHHQARRRLDHVGDGADVADGVQVVEDLRRLNDRIVRTVGARRLTPEMHGIDPPRAYRLLKLIELLDDRRRVRLRWCRRLVLRRQMNGCSAGHDDKSGAACRNHHRVPWLLHTAYRNLCCSRSPRTATWRSPRLRRPRKPDPA